MRIFKISTLLFLGLLIAVPAQQVFAEDEVVVYSARKTHLIRPLFDAFTTDTGIRVKFITDKAGPLLQRLKAEGSSTPTDILMTVDAGNLWRAAEEGVLAKTDSALLNSKIPAHLRDEDGYWFGLSVRARTLVYNTNRLKPEEMKSYEDLADPKWQGRLCLRTSKKVYNQSLVAMMIARHGEEQTEAIVKGWVANLAAQPFSNDTAVIQAIAAGQCDVGIVNTYYLGRLVKKTPDLPLAVFWPNQDSTGVHVNISGAGITKHAKNPEHALQLIEWLASDKAQSLFASLNMEYPVNPELQADPLVQNWGSFKQDDINLAKAGKLQAQAVKLMGRAGYK